MVAAYHVMKNGLLTVPQLKLLKVSLMLELHSALIFRFLRRQVNKQQKPNVYSSTSYQNYRTMVSYPEVSFSIDIYWH
jgi:hypothetical protein